MSADSVGVLTLAKRHVLECVRVVTQGSHSAHVGVSCSGGTGKKAGRWRETTCSRSYSLERTEASALIKHCSARMLEGSSAEQAARASSDA